MSNMIPIQLDFPTLLRRSGKINANSRSSIKQLMCLFNQKFDLGFSAYQIVAKLKIGN